jgi:hypothetical protein
MRTLYIGLTGDDVRLWEYFLLGINPLAALVADGTFDQATKDETKKFQSKVGFTGRDVDGVVGPSTMGKAMELGFNPLNDNRDDDVGPNWPPAPAAGPLSAADRSKLFGKFAYRAAGTQQNPEAIVITDGWEVSNIVTVEVPQLVGLAGPKGKVSVHKLIVPQLQRTFAQWEAAGLKNRLLTWGGLWVPRFSRGSRTYLSNHAWGTAFDINVQWNMLGTRPALKGQKGCVRELVEIANQNGFYWGGHFRGRPDGMHFEARAIIP